ncbi:hypothetical protein [Sciscionella marina]|uniref:hypothetical protein n=1 Tax=Sciscionella marina TaxID=508770 RepID=UPI00036709BA|nr:hypothetical protein [Sciscionella marina]
MSNQDPSDENQFMYSGQPRVSKEDLERARSGRWQAATFGGLILAASIALAFPAPTWLWLAPGGCGAASIALAVMLRKAKTHRQAMFGTAGVAFLVLIGLCLLALPLKYR